MHSLQNSLGFMLNAASRSMNRMLAQHIAPYGLTTSQYITLWALWESGEELPVSQLGRRLFLDNPTMTGIVDRMVRDGLLERVPDESDRRVIKVRLTEKSIQLYDQVKGIGTELDRAMSRLTDEDSIEQFMEYLKRISPGNGNEDK